MATDRRVHLPDRSPREGKGRRSKACADDVSPALELRAVHKFYGTEVHALNDVDLSIRAGEFVTLLGPSGSGKTTLLMVIAGFEDPSEGEILSDGEDITVTPPERRNFGIVFQSYALFPHMSVAGNIGYPLAARGIRGAERQQQVSDALKLVGLEAFHHRRPNQLSGGQQQRVALARALVYRPRMLLLDEPLGALDRELRERMQIELSRLHRIVGVTFVYVTHDQDEALRMSDRIVVLSQGRIEQIGPPDEIYSRPATAFVASFVGTANLLRGRVVSREQGLANVQLDDGGTVDVRCVESAVPGAKVLVVVRPENVRVIGADGFGPEGGERKVSGHIEFETFGGSSWRYQVTTKDGPWQAIAHRRLNIAVGAAVDLCWRPDEASAVLDDTSQG